MQYFVRIKSESIGGKQKRKTLGRRVYFLTALWRLAGEPKRVRIHCKGKALLFVPCEAGQGYAICVHGGMPRAWMNKDRELLPDGVHVADVVDGKIMIYLEGKPNERVSSESLARYRRTRDCD